MQGEDRRRLISRVRRRTALAAAAVLAALWIAIVEQLEAGHDPVLKEQASGTTTTTTTTTSSTTTTTLPCATQEQGADSPTTQ